MSFPPLTDGWIRVIALLAAVYSNYPSAESTIVVAQKYSKYLRNE